MTYTELVQARHRNIPLIWNDPDPVDGNDYSIKSIVNLNEDSDECLIQYGSGVYLSEATVFLSEISVNYDLLEDIAGFIYDRVNVKETPLTESHIEDLTQVIKLALLNSQGKLSANGLLSNLLF